MKYEMLPDASAAARAGATFIAGRARQAIAERGRFVMALSGGRTPWRMLRDLAREDVAWTSVHVAQVDERLAPACGKDRNLTYLQEILLSHASLPPQQLHAMPVEAGDLVAAAAAYGETLRAITGSTLVLDLVHLGLGSDGHTASLVPGDPVLHVVDRDVALTHVYHGYRRMTLTYPALNRAREILWMVTGQAKVKMLERLRSGDSTIPAGRVRRDNATILCDRAAAGPGSTSTQR